VGHEYERFVFGLNQHEQVFLEFSPSLLVDENFTALRTSHVRMETAPGFAASEIYQTVPWKLPATPGIVRLPTPGLGEHNAEVFGRLLGLGERELDGLRERGVI